MLVGSFAGKKVPAITTRANTTIAIDSYSVVAPHPIGFGINFHVNLLLVLFTWHGLHRENQITLSFGFYFSCSSFLVTATALASILARVAGGGAPGHSMGGVGLALVTTTLLMCCICSVVLARATWVAAEAMREWSTYVRQLGWGGVKRNSKT